MKLHKALEFAVILSWQDLLKVETPACVRVEYECEAKSPLDHLTIWLDKGKGYSDRVCDYWTRTSPAHPQAMRFWKGHDSGQLARALAFIMQNQDRFTSPTTARDGLVLIYPPGEAECSEAAAWEETALGAATTSGKQPVLATSN
jgi:hypothetical protein